MRSVQEFGGFVKRRLATPGPVMSQDGGEDPLAQRIVSSRSQLSANHWQCEKDYLAAVMDSTWMVLLLASSVPTTRTFCPANFAGVFWSLNV